MDWKGLSHMAKAICRDCLDFRNCYEENRGLLTWFLGHMKMDITKMEIEIAFEELFAENCKDYEKGSK